MLSKSYLETAMLERERSSPRRSEADSPKFLLWIALLGLVGLTHSVEATLIARLNVYSAAPVLERYLGLIAGLELARWLGFSTLAFLLLEFLWRRRGFVRNPLGQPRVICLSC